MPSLLKPVVVVLSTLVVLQVLGVPVVETVTGWIGTGVEAGFRALIDAVTGWLSW